MRRRIGFGAAAASLLIGTVLTAGVAGATEGSTTANRFTVTDLGQIGTGACCSSATDVNDRGQIVGNTAVTDGVFGPSHAFLRTAGQMRDLGTVAGTQSEAAAVNRNGDVVGMSTVDAEDTVRHAVLWRRGQVIDLGAAGGFESFATDVNDRGQVVGGLLTDDGLRAFRWENGRMTLLPTPAGFRSLATAINNRGEIVGQISAPVSQPVRWANGRLQRLPVAPTTFAAGAEDVNERGQVLIGASETDGGNAGYLLTGSRLTPLGLPAGHDTFLVNALNDRGDVAGDAGGDAVLLRDGHFVTLPKLGPDARAIGLNNRGTIVGSSSVPDGLHAVSWR